MNAPGKKTITEKPLSGTIIKKNSMVLNLFLCVREERGEEGDERVSLTASTKGGGGQVLVFL